MIVRTSARVVLAAVVLLGATACSSSKHSSATTATTTTGAQVESPIVVKTPVSNSQWRSPISVKGTTSLSGELSAEVLDSSGKHIGSKKMVATDGHFSVVVPFEVKKLVPGAVLVHDEKSDHSVQISVVLTP